MMPTDALRQWLQGNPAAPASLRRVASKLVGYHDATALWAEFAPHDGVAVAVCSYAHIAWTAQQAEVGRQTPKEESDALALVGKRLNALRDAIETAPLPRARSTVSTITAAGMPDVLVRVGWRELPDGPALSGFGYPITVLEILNLAAVLLEQHIAALPARAVGKHIRGGRPDVKSFVTQLTYLFSVSPRFNDQPRHAAVAHVTNAVFELDTPKGESDIRAMLLTSSDEWRQVVKRRDPIA